MTATVSAYVRRETAISTVINMAIGAGIFLAMFGRAGTVPVWGAGGYVADFLPQGFMIGLMAALVPSQLARRQVARGTISAQTGHSALPRSLPARCLLIAVGSMIVLAGGAAVVLAAAGAAAVPFAPALAVKIASSGALAAVVTPLAIRATLAQA